MERLHPIYFLKLFKETKNFYSRFIAKASMVLFVQGLVVAYNIKVALLISHDQVPSYHRDEMFVLCVLAQMFLKILLFRGGWYLIQQQDFQWSELLQGNVKPMIMLSSFSALAGFGFLVAIALIVFQLINNYSPFIIWLLIYVLIHLLFFVFPRLNVFVFGGLALKKLNFRSSLKSLFKLSMGSFNASVRLFLISWLTVSVQAAVEVAVYWLIFLQLMPKLIAVHQIFIPLIFMFFLGFLLIFWEGLCIIFEVLVYRQLTQPEVIANDS